MKKRTGRYVTVALLVAMLFLAIHHLTGMDALGLAGRVMGRGLSQLGATLLRLAGSAVQVLVRGIGWRRLSRVVTAVAGIRIGYAASVVMSDGALDKARGWQTKLRLFAGALGARWRSLPLWLKLLLVAALIASQAYLHFALILFPIGFMVPIARRVFVMAADQLIGAWYRKSFGVRHRTFVRKLRGVPGVRHLIEGRRLLRIRYLRAWRLWRHDPRYRDPVTNRRRRSFVEPVRLWRRRELDTYVGRPLLSGRRHADGHATDEPSKLLR
jgi:hypothetical protein